MLPRSYRVYFPIRFREAKVTEKRFPHYREIYIFFIYFTHVTIFHTYVKVKRWLQETQHHLVWTLVQKTLIEPPHWKAMLQPSL